MLIPNRSLKPSVMYVGKAHKHYTRPERSTCDKISSLFGGFVNCGCKKFHNIGFRWKDHETFFFVKTWCFFLASIRLLQEAASVSTDIIPYQFLIVVD